MKKTILIIAALLSGLFIVEAEAALAFQAAGAAVSGTGSVSPAWPAHAINDVALLFVESAGGQAATLSVPAGFAAVTNSPQATGAGTAGTRITVFWARATSAAMAKPTVLDPGNHVYARIITYRGAVITGNPWDVTGGGVKAAASTSVTVTGVTTTVANTLIVQAVARDNDSNAAAFSAETNVNLTGIAERSDAGTTSGNGGGFAVWDGVKATAGATGNTTATVTNSINAFLTIALMPDITPPTVSSITLANASPTGAASVAWTVVFSESVTGVDAADFSLVQAGGVSGASITSVTGSGTTWTVTANTGSNSGTLGLNLVDNDTILDMAGNKLGGTGLGNGNFTGAVYTIDKLNPSVTSINRAAADPTAAASVSWTVVFSESVTGVDATDFSLVQAGGVSGASITSVAGSGTTWTVTANTGTGTGTLGLNLVDDDTIKDATSNPLGGAGAGNGNFTGQVYTIDRTAPAVTSINTADANPSTANTVSWTVVFSENVTGVDSSDFTLAASGLTGAYIASVTGSGATWTVVANTGICTGACTLGLNLVDDDTIIDVVGNKLGGAGAGNGNFTGQVYTISSTSALAEYRMDEASWNGTANEVADSSGNGNNAQSFNSASTDGATPAIAGTCRYGVFDNGGTITQGYISLPDLGIDVLGDFTITAWIRTTNNTIANQRILTDDDGTTNSYGLSLGDGGTGKLRFYVIGASPANLDTANVIANNTWYYVAGVADIANGQRSIYVFNAAGTLVTSATTAVTATVGPVGPPGTPTISAPSTKHFKGNLDEVRVYGKVLNQAALTTLAQATHTCAAVVPDHLEIQHASGTGLTCATSTLTIKACTDVAVPCISPFTGGVSGTLSATGAPTVNWDGTTGGAAGAGFVIPNGGSSVTKDVQVATAGSVVFGITSPSPVPTNTTTCNFGAPACTFTANTAGFIFSDTTTGNTYTIPAQVSGIATSTLYLRAVQASTTNPAVCTPAIISQTTAVNMGYACNNPNTCQAGNLATITNTITSTATAIAPAGTSVSLNFDANGSAPITARYDDVGQITLNASKTVTPFGGATAIALNGNSNSYVVAPHHFGFSGITAGPIKAGNNFGATVTAYNGLGTPTATFNFGKETSPESATVTFTKCQPTGTNAVNGSFSGSVGSFNNGAASAANLNWSDVGNGDLVATLTSGSYLGSVLTATGNTGTGGTACNGAGNVAAFIPDHFITTVTDGCVGCGFTYSGQPFTVTVTAMNGLATPAKTFNYDGTVNTSPNFANNVTLSDANAVAAPVGVLGVSASPMGVTVNAVIPATTPPSTTLAVPKADFTQGEATLTGVPTYTFNTSPTTPTTIKLRAVDTVNASVTSSGFTEGTTEIRSGRVKIGNAHGSELLTLLMTATVQYYNAAGSWVTGTTDSVTSLTFGLTNYLCKTGCAWTTTPTPLSGQITTGVLSFKLSKPTGGGTGSVDVSIAAPDYLLTASNGAAVNPSKAGRATFGVYKGAKEFIYLRENY